MEKKFLFIPLILFLISNLLGLLSASQLLTTQVVEETVITNSNPISGLYFFLSLMVATAIILILYKFKVNFLIKGWFYLALFSTTFLFFGSFFSFIIAVLLAISAVLIRIFVKSLFVQNLICVCAFAGAGSFFGVTVGVIPSLVIIMLLSVYDIIAVHFTKHMVSLAKSGFKTNTLMAFMYHKKKTKESKRSQKSEKGKIGTEVGVLGGGDIIIPMIFSISIFRVFGLWASISSILVSALFLSFLMFRAKKGKVYPGLPAVCSGALIGFLIWLGLSLLW